MDSKEKVICGIIYKATNLINGKIYIGQTTMNFRKRILKHKRDAEKIINKGIVFHNAIRNYGFESFNWSIIDHAYNFEELNDKEVYWISFYNSYVHTENSNGYNLTLGGHGSRGYIATKETRKKLSKMNAGRKHSDESKRKMSESNKGKKRTPDMVKALKERMIGKYIGHKNPNASPVVQISANGEFIQKFRTINEAVEMLRNENSEFVVTKASISACCRRKCVTAYEYKWMYESDYAKYKNGELELNDYKLKDNSIVMFDFKFNKLNIFKTLKKAETSTKYNYKTITVSCKNKGSLIYDKKYRFMHYSDYNYILGSGELEKLQLEYQFKQQEPQTNFRWSKQNSPPLQVGDDND